MDVFTLVTHLNTLTSDSPFELPNAFGLTEFEKHVLKEISRIPCGQTLSYQQLAERLNTSPRAVANACRKNPMPIVIPCHRVVGKNSLGGYFGHTDGPLLELKKALLEHEKRIST